jgi:putative restriction endonuclease
MTIAIAPLTRTRLHTLARENGFDLDRGDDAGWLTFDSTHAPLRLWLTALGDTFYAVAVSKQNVADALVELAPAVTNPKPAEARGAVSATSLDALRTLIRRAHVFANTLPNELLHVFQHKIRGMPRTTEAERLVIQRVGQDVFRDGLLRYWEGRCAVTGLAVPEVLRASHIKRWAACETDEERLDVNNGLLLAPHLDAVFDCGLLTVADDGALVASSRLDGTARSLLGLAAAGPVSRLGAGHRSYLAWHRAEWFKA